MHMHKMDVIVKGLQGSIRHAQTVENGELLIHLLNMALEEAHLIASSETPKKQLVLPHAEALAELYIAMDPGGPELPQQATGAAARGHRSTFNPVSSC